MRLKILLPCLTVALIAAAGMTIWSGCDVSSATEKIRIDPSDVTLSKGQSQVFTVSGGYEYTWSLSDDASGSLDTRHGDTVTFTLLKDASSGTSNTTAGTVTITCTSFIPGTPQGTTGTNSTSSSGYNETATALVHILNGLSLSPGSATIAAGTSMGLSVTGGSGSYVWSASGFGTLSPFSGPSVTFLGTTAGTAIITVTDSDGLTASCTVTITGSGGSTLTVTPQNTHVAAGASVPIFATGGSGNYTSWVVTGPNVTPNNGTLNTSSGAAVIYTAPVVNGSYVVTVTDSAGTPFPCAITVP